MKSLKYYLLVFIFIFFLACSSNKEINKEELNSSIEEINTTKDIEVPKEIKNKIQIKEKSLLEKKLDIYLEAMQTFNTTIIVNMTYPRLFTVIDHELFTQYITTMINSTDIKMTTYRTNVSKISAIKSFSNGTEFAQIDYKSTITLQFINPNLYASRKQLNYLYDVQINKFGVKNVFIDVKKRILKVTKSEKLLAIKEQNTQWKFLGNDARYRKYFPNFMPIEILQNIE